MSKLQMKMAMSIGVWVLALAPMVHADEWNQKTIFTFSAPVEIPGRILPAGTYVFKLADSSSNRNIVQVFNDDQTQLFATFLAIPDYRLRPSGKTIITFAERPAGSPDAIKGWFYPGRNHGHEFVYPKAKAVELAETRHTPVPAMPTELAEETAKPAVSLNGPEVAALDVAPLVAEEPDGQEVEIAVVFMAAPAPQAEAPQESQTELPQRLPSTASAWPLIGLIGALSLAAGIALRAAKARAN